MYIRKSQGIWVGNVKINSVKINNNCHGISRTQATFKEGRCSAAERKQLSTKEDVLHESSKEDILCESNEKGERMLHLIYLVFKL
jgi:hypothetical protein